MNVDENIGKAIGSAGGISEIYTAMNKDPLAGMNTSKMTPEQIEAAKKQGEKQNGLAMMSGIQGAFAGLQGLFGGEAGSDTSQLLGGLGGLGAGVVQKPNFSKKETGLSREINSMQSSALITIHNLMAKAYSILSNIPFPAIAQIPAFES